MTFRKILSGMLLLFVFFQFIPQSIKPVYANSSLQQELPFSFTGKIAYSDQDFNIQVLDGKTGKFFQITSDGLGSRSPSGYINNIRPLWSPDGQKILFCKEELRDKVNYSSLVIYSFTTGSQIDKVENAICPADWSPDSQSVVYGKINTYELNASSSSAKWISSSGIWVYELNSKKEQEIIPKIAEGPLTDPKWSPDGKYLLFREVFGYVHEGYGTIKIWDKTNGSIYDGLKGKNEKAGSARWINPHAIVFDEVVVHDLPDYGIYYSDETISNIRDLLVKPGKSISKPIVSNDYSKIAAYYEGEAIHQGQIYFAPGDILIFNSNAPEEKNYGKGRPIDWSPDNSMLLFINDSQLGILNVQTNQRYMISNTGNDSADWSPVDSSIEIIPTQETTLTFPGKIAYSGQDSNLWVLDGKTNERTQITFDAKKSNGDDYISYKNPNWSPESKRLVFCKIEKSTQKSRSSLIIFDFYNKKIDATIDNADCYADWSPTSDSIIYGKSLLPDGGGNGTGIWMLDLNKNSNVELIQKNADYIFLEPDWSPDGNLIKFRNQKFFYKGRGPINVWEKSTGKIHEAFLGTNPTNIGDSQKAGNSKWIAPNNLIFDSVSNEVFLGSSLYFTDIDGKTNGETKAVSNSGLANPIISPDSKLFAASLYSDFHDVPNFGQASHKVEILVFDIDDQNALNLGEGIPIDFSPNNEMILSGNKDCKLNIIEIKSKIRSIISDSFSCKEDEADWSSEVVVSPPAKTQPVIENETKEPPELTKTPESKNSVLLKNIIPIKQLLDPPVVLSNGRKDYGIRDCSIASMSMALEYFKKTGILPNNVITDYRSLIPMVRGTKSPELNLNGDPSYVLSLTNNILEGLINGDLQPEEIPIFIKQELIAGRPVLVAVYWNLLVAQWDGKVSHSVIVYGIDGENIFYVDPQDGIAYSQKIVGFTKAATYTNPKSKTIYTTLTYFREK